MKSLCTSFVLLSAIGTLAFGSLLGGSVVEAAEPLRYEFKEGQKCGYKVTIFAELPSSKTTYEGIILYEAKAAGKPFRLECTGELNVKEVHNATDYNGIMMPPRHLGRAFNSLFNSLRHFSTKIEIAPDGKTLKVKGTRHIPFLLGDISTLVFERLDGTRQDAWTLKRDMAVSEVSQLFRGFAPFMRGGMETVSSADETQSFKLLKKRGEKRDEKRDDGLLDFEKTYRFETACDEGKFTLEGKGLWTFNQKLGASESLKMKYELIEEKSNISVKIPLEIEYARLSESELAEHQKKKEIAKQKAKELHEKRKAPITAKDQQEYIESLTSGDEKKQRKTLQELSMRNELTPNQAIADAIRPLTGSSSSMSRTAKRALAKVSKKAGLKEAYKSSMRLDDNEIGRLIRKGTKLPAGLIIAAQKRHGHWYLAARVVRELSEEEYYVEFQGRSHGQRQKEVVEWSRIRLAPRELEQPEVDEADLRELYGDAKEVVKPTEQATSKPAAVKSKQAELAALKDFRTWTDSSGTFQVTAKYAGGDDTSVQLQQRDGSKLEVPLDRLSKEDRQTVERLRSMPNNPFQSNPFK